MGEFIMMYWLESLFTLIVGILAASYKTIRQEIKEGRAERRALKAGIQVMLRDRIVQAYNYYSEQNCLPLHDRDNLLNMYDQYHTLGANGVIDDLVRELFELPYSTPDCGIKKEG